ncbi:flagellar hook-associated protein FlgL [Frateuria defendens]|uniref:flagellar hook-associated protein FlgL n=1 Tax=Frateuria defendens TaxID=2219559 RepID=UPI0009E44AF3|nr:flagellar hook-associated protein FlgL [Frateuria defendens]
MIRLSTSWMYQQSLSTMLAQQGALSATQGQVSSGKRIGVASDDPAGAAQVVNLDHVLAATAQYSSNIDGANTRLSTETSTLNSVTSLLDQARTLAVQGINGTLSQADRDDMATQLGQIRSQLVQLANTTDANGNALFAGTATTTTPFTLNADSSVSYAGDDGQQRAAIGSGLSVPNGDPGSALFLNLPAGNGDFVASAGGGNGGSLVVGGNSVSDPAAWNVATAGGPADYTITFAANGNWTATDGSGNPLLDASGNPVAGTYQEGGSISFNGMTLALSGTPAAGDTVSVKSGTQQDVFTTLGKMIDALHTGDQTGLGNVFNRQIESLDQALEGVSNTQVQVGSRLNMLQQQQSTYADLNVTYQSALSNVRDVDMASAIGKLSLQSTVLQASQQVFAKVQGMSLFDYLK